MPDNTEYKYTGKNQPELKTLDDPNAGSVLANLGYEGGVAQYIKEHYLKQSAKETAETFNARVLEKINEDIRYENDEREKLNERYKAILEREYQKPVPDPKREAELQQQWDLDAARKKLFDSAAVNLKLTGDDANFDRQTTGDAYRAVNEARIKGGLKVDDATMGKLFPAEVEYKAYVEGQKALFEQSHVESPLATPKGPTAAKGAGIGKP